MFWLQPEDLCPCRFCRRLVPSCRPCPRVSSRRFWHTVYSAQARCDPTARRLLVKDALRGASATRPRSATPLGRVGLDGSPPPVRSAGSRAWWSSPRQPGGPHCRPLRKSLGMDDAHTMGIRLKQTNRLSRGYAWRWFESRRIRRSRGTIVEHLPLLCPEPDGGPKVGNASSLAILRCTLLPSLAGSCRGYQTALRLQGRSLVPLSLPFQRGGRSGAAICEPRGRGDGPAWRGNTKRVRKRRTGCRHVVMTYPDRNVKLSASSTSQREVQDPSG